MTASPRRSNATHRKRLARRLAAATGRPYAACLDDVRHAAAAGMLPEPLDEAGIAAAVRLLTTTPKQTTSTLTDVDATPSLTGAFGVTCTHAARTGEGYWTCDVPGGCADCRDLASEIDDDEQINEWDAQRQGTHHDPRPERPGHPPTATDVLAQSADPVGRALRAAATAPDRRIASDPRDQPIWDASWAYHHLTGTEALLYITSPGSGKDRYVFASGNSGGHVAHGRDEALTHVLGLLAGVQGGLVAIHEAARLDDPAAPADRRPYVGDGADGALRSARIDLEEADGLDRDDPRRSELLASADRWQAQADRLRGHRTP